MCISSISNSITKFTLAKLLMLSQHIWATLNSEDSFLEHFINILSILQIWTFFEQNLLKFLLVHLIKTILKISSWWNKLDYYFITWTDSISITIDYDHRLSIKQILRISYIVMSEWKEMEKRYSFRVKKYWLKWLILDVS